MEKASDSRDDGLEAAAEVMEDALKIIESCQVSDDTLLSCICQVPQVTQKYICPPFLEGPQRITTGRLVPALPGAKLQPDLPQVPKSPQDLPPGEPGLAQRPQMASHMVRRYFPMTQITLTMYNHNRVSIFLTMHSLKQVFEGLRLLPEDADGERAVADGGAQEEPEEARQDQLNLVDVLGCGLGLPLLLLLGREQVHEGWRVRQVLRRTTHCLAQPIFRNKCVFHLLVGGSL